MAGPNDGWEDVPESAGASAVSSGDGGWEDVPMAGNTPQLTKPLSNSGDSANDIINDDANDAIDAVSGIAAPFTNPVGVAKGLWALAKGATARAAAPIERGIENLLIGDPERASLEKDLTNQRAGIRAQTFDQLVNDKDQRYVGRDANGNFSMSGTLDKLGTNLVHKPFTTALDLATVAAPATSAVGDFATASRLPGLTRVVNAAQTAGRYVNPLTAVEKGAALAGKVASLPVSVLSGMSPQAQALILKGAYKGGTVAKQMMGQVRGSAPMDAPLQLLDSAMNKIKSEGMTAYIRNQNLWKQDPTILNHQPIFDALTRAEQRALSDTGTAGTVDAVTGNTTPTTGFVKDPIALQKIQQMRDIVLDHLTDPTEKHNVASFDALKQRLGTVLDDVKPGSRAEGAVLDAYNTTKQAILDQTPGYAKAMAEYEDMLDKMHEIKRTFSAKQTDDEGNLFNNNETVLGKLQSALRDDVSSRFGYKRTMLDELAKHEPSLPYVLAGQAGKTPLSRGIAGRLTELGSLLEMTKDPVPAAIAIGASSPRLVSETLNLAGKTGRIGKALGFTGANLARRMRNGYQLSQTPQANQEEPNPFGLLGNMLQ